MGKKSKRIMVLTAVAIFGITTLAFAGWSSGYGHMMGSDSWGPGQEEYYGNLSADGRATLDQLRAEYFKATDNIRQKLYQTELALTSELAKQNPDMTNASRLQGELSNLQAELDQKSLDYEFKVKKAVPNYNRGYMGRDRMMGSGHRRGSYCMW